MPAKQSASAYLKSFGIACTPPKRKAKAKPRKNPAPRIGTAKPKRVSQVTKKAPSKRLVARRVVNSKKGYFPNPSQKKPPVQRKTTIIKIIRGYQAMIEKEKDKIVRQSYLSYAQGLVDGAKTLGYFDDETHKEFMDQLRFLAGK